VKTFCFCKRKVKKYLLKLNFSVFLYELSYFLIQDVGEDGWISRVVAFYFPRNDSDDFSPVDQSSAGIAL